MRFERIVSKDKKSQSWISANCKVIFINSTVMIPQSELVKKRRDFFARQGTAKRRLADVLAYVEEAARSRDAA